MEKREIYGATPEDILNNTNYKKPLNDFIPSSTLVSRKIFFYTTYYLYYT